MTSRALSIREACKRLGCIAPSTSNTIAFIRDRLVPLTDSTARNAAPVPLFTVSREIDHGGDAFVKRVYAHLGEVRHRSEVIEYRIEQHQAQLAPKLKLLRSA